MNPSIVRRFDAVRADLHSAFLSKHPESYTDIVKTLVAALSSAEDGCDLDPERIHVIDDGDYQGCQLFIIAEKGYQPSTYWVTMCYYGSCSGCDTLQSIRGYGDDKPSEAQAKDYVTLALHLAQQMKLLPSPQAFSDTAASAE